MSELFALLMLVVLFVVRFIIPLAVIVGIGRLLDRVYARWEAQDKLIVKT